MAQYISKTETVEARQYEDPQPLTVVHNDVGDQVAHKGDWLIGTERGKISVMSDADFQAKYEPFTDTPEADALKSAESKVADLSAQVTALSAENATLTEQLAAVNAEKTELAGQVGDTQAMAAHVTDLMSQLTAEQAKSAAANEKIAALQVAAKAAENAQAALDASQATLSKTLGQ